MAGDVFVSAVVEASQRAWAAPGEEASRQAWAGGRRARQHCGARHARPERKGPMRGGRLTELRDDERGGCLQRDPELCRRLSDLDGRRARADRKRQLQRDYGVHERQCGRCILAPKRRGFPVPTAERVEALRKVAPSANHVEAEGALVGQDV